MKTPLWITPVWVKVKSALSFPLTPEKYIQLFFLIFVSALALAAAILLFVDPYIYYHRSIGLRQVYTRSTAMIPGVLRHFEYDTVLFGSSMVQNFDISEMDKLLGTRSVKATTAGLTADTLSVYFDIAFASRGDNLKRCIAGVDYYAFDRNGKKLHAQYDYLYGNKLFTPQYLWSKDSFDAVSEALWNNISYPFDKVAQHEMDFNLMFSNKPGRHKYGRKYIERDIRNRTGQMIPLSSKVRDNFRNLLFKHVKNHPDTQFDIFLPPYSIYFWCVLDESGQLEDYLALRRFIVEEAALYKNARLHDFQTDLSIICDLDNYKDFSHYSPKINSSILKGIASNSHIVTPKTASRGENLIRQSISTFRPSYNALRRR